MEIKKTNLKWNGTRKKRTSTIRIILHCSATPEGKNYTVEQIHNMHLKNSWAGIGYNFYIDLDGVIWEGRGEEYVGAHTTNYNSNSIGICYCGGMDKDMKHSKDTRTPAQKASMLELLKYLHKKYPNATIHGHNEFAAKACPSFKVSEYLKNIDLEDNSGCICSSCPNYKSCTKNK